MRFQGGVYHAPRVGGGTTGGNLVNNQPANRTLQIDFGNIDHLASLTGTAMNTALDINAVEVEFQDTDNLQLLLRRAAGHRLQDVMEVGYVGSFARHLGETSQHKRSSGWSRGSEQTTSIRSQAVESVTISCGRFAAMPTSTWSPGRHFKLQLAAGAGKSSLHARLPVWRGLHLFEVV